MGEIWQWNDAPDSKFMGPTWDPPGSCRLQMGPMLAPWTLHSGTRDCVTALPKRQWASSYLSDTGFAYTYMKYSLPVEYTFSEMFSKS